MLALAIAALETNAVRLGFRSSDAAVRTALGGRTETEHADILYPRGKSPEEVERLGRDVEFRLRQLGGFFGAPPPAVRVVVFRSPEEKQRWVGAGGTQFAKPWLGSVYLNDAPFPHPTLQHELAHVAAGAFGSGPFRVTSRWGLPLMGVVEGVAVAADDPPRRAHLARLGGGHAPPGVDARSARHPRSRRLLDRRAGPGYPRVDVLLAVPQDRPAAPRLLHLSSGVSPSGPVERWKCSSTRPRSARRPRSRSASPCRARDRSWPPAATSCGESR